MNLVESPKMIDYDGAKLYMHALEMCRNGSFFLPDWNYITTMELDCSLLLAVPFYALIHEPFNKMKIILQFCNNGSSDALQRGAVTNGDHLPQRFY